MSLGPPTIWLPPPPALLQLPTPRVLLAPVSASLPYPSLAPGWAPPAETALWEGVLTSYSYFQHPCPSEGPGPLHGAWCLAGAQDGFQRFWQHSLVSQDQGTGESEPAENEGGLCPARQAGGTGEGRCGSAHIFLALSAPQQVSVRPKKLGRSEHGTSHWQRGGTSLHTDLWNHRTLQQGLGSTGGNSNTSRKPGVIPLQSLELEHVASWPWHVSYLSTYI